MNVGIMIICISVVFVVMVKVRLRLNICMNDMCVVINVVNDMDIINVVVVII